MAAPSNNPAVAELLRKQDEAKAIEAEIMALTEVLDSMPGKPGVKGPLVDREGFPRADVDVHEVRNHRNRIACLQTDHVNAMKEVEQALFALHQATKGGRVSVQPLDSEPSGPNSAPQAAAPTHDAAPQQQQPAAVRAEEPFALVDQVSDASPASRAGLAVGDRVVRMGHVTKAEVSAQGMGVLSGVVRNHEGRPLAVSVLGEGGGVRELSLTPGAWAGQGLLGCHLAAV